MTNQILATATAAFWAAMSKRDKQMNEQVIEHKLLKLYGKLQFALGACVASHIVRYEVEEECGGTATMLLAVERVKKLEDYSLALADECGECPETHVYPLMSWQNISTRSAQA